MRTKFLAVMGICVLIVGSILTMNSGFLSADTGKKKVNASNNGKVKNVIVLIGDGMGPAYTAAYRYMHDDPTTPKMERTIFDEYFVGMASTNPEDAEENVTDSAAAATAMAAGIKTYNGAISVDNDRESVKTVLEAAKAKGMATGLVATSQINHATPAAFGAHDVSRYNYNDIADDYFDDMINGEHKIDVLLGGGTKYFDREDRNLIKEFKGDDYSYVTTTKEMLANENENLLGLFAPVGLPKAIDRRESTPSLEEMTKAALKQLKKDKDGFFLMVEGSQIDWAGHANDSVGIMSEMEDFAKAFDAVIEFAKKNKHTQVVLTADHSTGGFSIGRGGEYNFNPEPIKAAERTPEFMAQEIVDGAEVEEVLNKYVNFTFTEEELESIKEAAEPEDNESNSDDEEDDDESDGDEEEQESDDDTDEKLTFDKVYSAIAEVFNKRAGAGFTTSGHTGIDVPVYAYGPKSEVFSGLIDNTDIANKIFNFLE